MPSDNVLAGIVDKQRRRWSIIGRSGKKNINENEYILARPHPVYLCDRSRNINAIIYRPYRCGSTITQSLIFWLTFLHVESTREL